MHATIIRVTILLAAFLASMFEGTKAYGTYSLVGGTYRGLIIDRLDYSSTGDFAGGGRLSQATQLQMGRLGLRAASRIAPANRASQVLFLRAGLAIERARFALETPAVSAAQAARGVMVPAGSTTTASLRVLSPGFVPDPSRVLQNLTTAENVALAANPRLALGVLSRPEYVAGQRFPTVARLSYGKAVERLVARKIRGEPVLRTFFDPRRIGGRGPDIIGKGLFENLRFDITTTNARTIAEHLARPYGQDLIIITYTRPAGFEVFPP